METLTYISKRYAIPFLAGATFLFYAPNVKRVVDENPNRSIKNSDENDLQKFYWKNSPRSAITSTLGAVAGTYFLADRISDGLVSLAFDQDPRNILTAASVLAATNFLSWCYEYPEMRKINKKN